MGSSPFCSNPSLSGIHIRILLFPPSSSLNIKLYMKDGNGRVARTLASIMLIKNGLLPFVVPFSERSAYLSVLQVVSLAWFVFA